MKACDATGRWSHGAPALVLIFLLTLLGGRTLGAQRPADPPTRATHASARPARSPSQSVPRRAAALVFDSVTVIDVVTGELREHQRVVVVGRRIQAVGPVDSVPRPARARLVSAAGQYLIPGLWDMHTHIIWLPHLGYRLLIANGITGARDPGNNYVPLATLRRWRREIVAGRRIGPRLIMTGDVAQPRDPAEARRLVDSLKAAGADFVKNYIDDPATYYALATEARRIGLRLEGHLSSVPLEESSDSGQRIIDHQSGVGRCWTVPPDRRQYMRNATADDTATATLETCRALAQHLRRNGTWLVPTLTHGFISPKMPRPYVPIEVRPEFEYMGAPPDPWPGEALALAQQAGMPLLAGTDNQAFGFKLHEELAAFVREGMTPLGALQAATLNAAEAYHMTDSLGTVVAGKLADLTLLADNPLQDIHNTSHVVGVVADGRYYDSAALRQLLVEARQLADRCPWRRPFVPVHPQAFMTPALLLKAPVGMHCTK